MLLYMLGQWREIGRLLQRRQARYGTLVVVSILVVLAILVAVNYLGARQNKRWDLTANQVVQPVGPDPQGAARSWTRRSRSSSSIRPRASTGSATGSKEYTYQSEAVTAEYVDPDTQPARAQQKPT